MNGEDTFITCVQKYIKVIMELLYTKMILHSLQRVELSDIVFWNSSHLWFYYKSTQYNANMD